MYNAFCLCCQLKLYLHKKMNNDVDNPAIFQVLGSSNTVIIIIIRKKNYIVTGVSWKNFRVITHCTKFFVPLCCLVFQNDIGGLRIRI